MDGLPFALGVIQALNEARSTLMPISRIAGHGVDGGFKRSSVFRTGSQR